MNSLRAVYGSKTVSGIQFTPDNWSDSYYWSFELLSHISEERDEKSEFIRARFESLQNEINSDWEALQKAVENADDKTAVSTAGSKAIAKKAFDASHELLVEFGYLEKKEETDVTTATPTTKLNLPDVSKYGDANCDDNVNMADAVLIMQSISNGDEFGLGKPDGITLLGSANADVAGNGDGVTPLDAQTIQAYTLELIDKLPE